MSVSWRVATGWALAGAAVLLALYVLSGILLPFIVGMAAARSSRAVARIVRVSAVDSGRVCDRVARAKSSKRSLSTTVRQTRRPPYDVQHTFRPPT